LKRRSFAHPPNARLRRHHARRHNPSHPGGYEAGASSVTAEEKAALIKGASQLLLDVLNKPLDATYVIIEEVDASNWGWGGLPALEYRRRRTAAT
jgi:4-oxalocrotonate tautomerase